MVRRNTKRSYPIQWSWLGLSQIIDLKDVLRYPGLPWQRWGLSHNKDISLEFIDAFDRITEEFGERSDLLPTGKRNGIMLLEHHGHWYWDEITRQLNISVIIEHRHTRPWDFSKITRNPSVTYDFLRTIFSDDVLVRHARYLPIDIVDAHVDLPWDRYLLSCNSGMTIALMDKIDRYAKENPTAAVHNEWNLDELSSSMAPEEIAKAPRLTWSRYWLSQNDRITIGFVLRHYEVRKLPRSYDRWRWHAILAKARDINDYDLDALPHQLDRPWLRLSWNPWLRDPALSRLTAEQRGRLVGEELAARLSRSLLFRYWSDWHSDMYDPEFMSSQGRHYIGNEITVRDLAQIDPVFRYRYYDVPGIVFCPQFADVGLMISRR